ncbi:Coenzyme F420 hydrogenase/dehydrogenase, beta subunit C-terminal domain [Postechiella marina]|uniref:Coenzyme F420 hydrogenase/dehydrogenase, beta subunit C-terminal domain n=1 Tax=Postechiella marina TaxID=943941 RepID=A0ABP8C1E0_9FLAO
MNNSIADIVNNDLCVGCGICVSESKSSKMIWNQYGFLVPKLDDSFNETAIKVCPFNTSPEDSVRDEDHLANIFLKDAKNIDDKIGKFENTYVGYSKANREKSSSGGLATYIFEQLLRRKIVNHIFVVKQVNGTYAYQWFNEAEHILKVSKTRYIPVTLENLFKEIDQKDGKVAVSGVACFTKAIRLKQHYKPEYKEKIPFIVGIICGGLKSSFFSDYLAQKSGIEGSYSKQEYRIKDPASNAVDYSFGAFNQENKFYQMKMKTVGDMWGTGLFKANACDFCDDVTTELADISLGDAWLDPYTKDGKGTSVIVSRTQFADQIIKEGILKKELSVTTLSLDSFKASQAGSFKHRQLGESFRLNKLKKSKSILPYKRKRMLKSIPMEFKIVQNARMTIRKASLEIWKNTQKSELFDLEILPYKKRLKRKTRWYHRIQNLRLKLGLKKL